MDGTDQSTPSKVTPAQVTNVSFDSQISQVQEALTARSVAEAKVREQARLVEAAFRKYNCTTTYATFTEPARMRTDVALVKVYQPVAEAPDDIKELLKVGYYLRFEGSNAATALKTLEKRFPGFMEFVEQLEYYSENGYNQRKVDDVKTDAAREEILVAVDAYAQAFDEYNACNLKLRDVEQYISVIEKIANVSAVANKHNGSK